MSGTPVPRVSKLVRRVELVTYLRLMSYLGMSLVSEAGRGFSTYCGCNNYAINIGQKKGIDIPVTGRGGP
jgi:hypothetical protein